MLADRSQGAVVHQRAGRADGHGRKVAPTNLVRSGLCHLSVRVSTYFNHNQTRLIDTIERSDGRGRAGVYCAANVAIEQVVQHGEVDVFQAVKTVRRHRPQLVENMVSSILNQLIVVLN